MFVVKSMKSIKSRYTDYLRLNWKTIVRRGGIKQALLEWGKRNKDKITPSIALKRPSLFANNDYIEFQINRTPVEMFDIVIGVDKDDNKTVKIYNYDWYEVFNSEYCKDIFDMFLQLYDLVANAMVFPDIYENEAKFIKRYRTFNDPIFKFIKSKIPNIRFFFEYRSFYNGKYWFDYTPEDLQNMKKDLALILDIMQNYQEHPLVKLAILNV